MKPRIFPLFSASLILALASLAAGCREMPADPDADREEVEKEEGFIGLSLRDAEKLAVKRGLPHRVTMLDRQPQMATRDYLPNRVNFAVEKGRVIGVSRG